MFEKKYYKEDFEVVFFYTEDELIEKVKFYLSNESLKKNC